MTRPERDDWKFVEKAGGIGRVPQCTPQRIAGKNPKGAPGLAFKAWISATNSEIKPPFPICHPEAEGSAVALHLSLMSLVSNPSHTGPSIARPNTCRSLLPLQRVFAGGTSSKVKRMVGVNGMVVVEWRSETRSQGVASIRMTTVRLSVCNKGRSPSSRYF